MWRKKAQLDDELRQLPSGKVGDASMPLSHVRQLLTILGRVCEFQFTQYCRKQKVMHNIYERVLREGGFEGDKRPSVVANGMPPLLVEDGFPTV